MSILQITGAFLLACVLFAVTAIVAGFAYNNVAQAFGWPLLTYVQAVSALFLLALVSSAFNVKVTRS